MKTLVTLAVIAKLVGSYEAVFDGARATVCVYERTEDSKRIQYRLVIPYRGTCPVGVTLS